MTKLRNQDNYSTLPNRKRLWLLILSRGGVTLGGLLLLAILGGISRLWNFVHKELAPLTEKNLTTTLNRPVKLGEITEFSLTGVRFGASAIPETATDPDRLAADAVEVGFDPLQLIFNRSLKLDVTLVNPNVYIEKDEQGRWLTTSIALQGKGGPIKTDLDKIRLRNGKLVLMPFPRTAAQLNQGKKSQQIPLTSQLPNSPTDENIPVAFSRLDGTAQLLENNQVMRFDVAGQANSGGNITVQGDTRLKTQAANLQLRGQDLLAADITRLIKLPINLQTGRVNGDLQIQLTPEQQPLLFGSALLQGVTIQVPRLPQLFNNSQGNLVFRGLEIQLDKVTTNYGKIPLVATGSIDRDAGFKLAGRVNQVSVVSALETLKVKLPIPVTGEVKADLQMVGPSNQPLLTGTVATIKTARIDKVDFKSISSKFEFSTSKSLVSLKDIQGTPTVGGEVTGAGTVQLGTLPQQNFNFIAKNVPGDAIAKIYDTIPTFQIGNISGTGQLSGVAGNIQTVVQWQAPRATYPATGTVAIAPDRTVSFRNVNFNFGGGTVQTSGSYANQRWRAVAQASGVEVERFVDKNKLQNVSLAGAEFNGRLILSGTTSPFKVATIRTEGAGVQVAGGTVAVSQIQLQDQNFTAQLIANGVRLGRLLKNSPPALAGPLAGTFQIAGNRDNFSLKTLRASGEAKLALGGGTVTASNIQLADGVYQTQLRANNVAVQQLAPTLKQFQGRLNGDFTVAGSVEPFQPQSIQASGQARVKVGSGTITASNIQLANGLYQAQLRLNKVPLQQLAAVPPQFQGALAGNFAVAGSVESFQPQSIQANGQGQLDVAGGTISASNIQLANGRYQAIVNAAGVELNQLNQQLRGQFAGQLQVAGTVGTSKLSDVRAVGQVEFSQGIAAIQQPLSAAIAWNGEKLTIEKATSTNLNASGYILANAQRAGIPEITQLNLNVQAQDYNLQQLPFKLPNAINLAGKADFSGQVTGKLPVPNLQGQLRLRNLVVKDFAFEPVLSGNIQAVQGQGVNLDLSGNSDRIAFNLDANNRPNSFAVKWQQASAIGQAQGDNLALKLENFPLQVLNLSLPANTRLGTGPLAGALTGNLQVNQQTFATNGNVAIANPAIGRIKGDLLSAKFRYGNGTATIIDSEFAKGKSRYAFIGNVGTSPKGPQIQGKLNVNEGQTQDVLTALQIFEFQDIRNGVAAPTYGTATDLVTTPQGLTNQPLLTQIERFYQVDALVAEQEQQRLEATPVPDLADLQGTFNGEIALDTATAQGLAVQFNLNGQNWIWGKEEEKDSGRYYSAERVIAEGSFENGVLRLRPLRIESSNRLVAFNGNIGGNDQSGSLQVRNFPLQVLNNFVKLPIGVTGNLNTTVALAGSINNPQAKGEIEIIEGTLNQKKIESATASFSYANSRLNFGSNVIVTGPEPVNIQGSIPYQLPFATVPPDNNQISLDVKVKNEGLALLNVLTNQVMFEEGEGEVDLTVRGTRQQPQVIGIASVKDATFSAQALPEKLRRVTGKVTFDFDRILVQDIQGRFSRGKVEASGEIPIFNNQEANIDNPLTVNLDQLTLNLKGLYQGGASGNLQITGSALNPVIGGKVQLFNGQVLLAESANNTNPANSSLDSSLTKANKQDKTDAKNTTARLNDLELVLGKKVQITRPPIINFQATGTLTVNGSLNQPVPDGTIRLEGGGVNLFTTQFNLARGYKHTATFRTDQPRDPNLDIRLFAKVLDGNTTTDISRFSTGLSSLETVRVEASIQGPASKLNENLQLTSSPARNETEIVALLGGGFIDTQGRGDSTLGLINIAGSAVFNNFQGAFNQIGNAFGLSELRLFPTVISENPEAGRLNSSLELALEAGVDISPKFSISSIKILTANDPFQWGINYRINDAIRLRASTNLLDDSRAIVEYDRRF
ncbi:MAG: translocation/assembly module TamB domain-containing protein [Mojavia pulchra JT2-VF2]|jgi:translocation and assembly module TamB|uniref:Translocation/assembly module TamB domain-containing protein n=1 Tax=Mojavia pulchra JT2-VF2 TaxID=287848 RepID=A0A951UHT0_9NOST|nr:translocation/assembly module TamB domain-containing protein [Mojavia pulchra JT2-VF2]